MLPAAWTFPGPLMMEQRGPLTRAWSRQHHRTSPFPATLPGFRKFLQELWGGGSGKLFRVVGSG
jgi:hypothetical protein